jgi:ADP-heptose:LPS heptosyltransferase
MEQLGSISVEVPCGVGDIWWTYQKLSPYCKKLNLRILIVDNGITQKRAEPWLRCLPKIGKIDYRMVSSPYYDEVAGTQYKVQDILDHPNEWLPYALNKPLEQGMRIDDIDQGYEVAWDFKLKSKAIGEHDDYVLFYTSGNKPDYTWDCMKWAELLRMVPIDTPIAMMGASYDQGVLEQVQQCIPNQSQLYIDVEPAYVVTLIREARCYLGYQSGLNVVAEHQHTPQLMVYFPYLMPMLYTWCRMESIKDTYYASTFDEFEGTKELWKKLLQKCL